MRTQSICLVGAMLLSGCSDKITLQGTDGVSLTYECSSPEHRAHTPGEVKLISQTAGRIIGIASDEGYPDRTHPLQAALDAADAPALERAVIEYSCTYGPPSGLPRFPERGSSPPEFALPRLNEAGDNREDLVRLSDHESRAFILIFWSTWCGPCRANYPELQALAQKAAAEDIAVYAVVHRDSPENVRRWQREHGSGVTFLLDPGERTARDYRVRGIPATFVVGDDGRIRIGGSGYAGARSLDALLVEAQRPSPPA